MERNGLAFIPPTYLSPALVVIVVDRAARRVSDFEAIQHESSSKVHVFETSQRLVETVRCPSGSTKSRIRIITEEWRLFRSTMCGKVFFEKDMFAKLRAFAPQLATVGQRNLSILEWPQ
jgi:hypothetical protein